MKNLLKSFLFIFLVSSILSIVSPVRVGAQTLDLETGIYDPNREFVAQNNTTSVKSGIFCRLGDKPKLQHLFGYASCIISNSIIPLIFALATVMFIWGVVQFVINSDEEAKKEKGRQFMIWGIIALTVMVSVWGLVAVLGNTFGVNTGFIPQVKSQ